MNPGPFDLIAVLVLVASVLAGIRTGALPQVGGIGGAIAGLLVVLQLAPWILGVTGDLEPLARAVVVIGAVLGMVIVGEAVGSALGRALASGVGTGVLSGLDRLAGGVLGAAQAVLIVWLAGGLLAAGPFPSLARLAGGSVAVRITTAYLPPPTQVIGEIAGVIDASGLPDVFVGLEPVPLEAVDIPSDPEAARIARSAAASTARVVTSACGVQVTGTAAVVGRGYLVTNAHVVAGADVVRVNLPSGTADARPVLFDPALDVAVLYAPRVDAAALRFATSDPGRGTMAAALGYAGGGPLQVMPAAVSGGYQATGRDIYGEAIVHRQVLELRAAIEPGDSGGPLVLGDGTIGGLVFAESRTDERVGYALSPATVAVRIRPALGRTDAVDVGRCIR